MTAKNVSIALKRLTAASNPTSDCNQVKRHLKVRQPTAEKKGNGVFSSKINDLYRTAKLPSTNWMKINSTPQVHTNDYWLGCAAVRLGSPHKTQKLPWTQLNPKVECTHKNATPHSPTQNCLRKEIYFWKLQFMEINILCFSQLFTSTPKLYQLWVIDNHDPKPCFLKSLGHVNLSEKVWIDS